MCNLFEQFYEIAKVGKEFGRPSTHLKLPKTHRVGTAWKRYIQTIILTIMDMKMTWNFCSELARLPNTLKHDVNIIVCVLSPCQWSWGPGQTPLIFITFPCCPARDCWDIDCCKLWTTFVLRKPIYNPQLSVTGRMIFTLNQWTSQLRFASWSCASGHPPRQFVEIS